MIKFGKKVLDIRSYNRSKGEIYFKVGLTSNAITLKNFDTSSFNVNGNIYRISGSKLVKR